MSIRRERRRRRKVKVGKGGNQHFEEIFNYPASSSIIFLSSCAQKKMLIDLRRNAAEPTICEWHHRT
jgi:hypothetical protein